MKSVSKIANGLCDQARSGDFIPASENPRALQVSEEQNTLVAAINELFKELRSIRSAWRQAWPDKETYHSSKRQWFQAFIEAEVCTPGQIAFGMSQVRKHPGDFIPSPGQFIEWCKPSPEMLGLPPLGKAHREACRNAHPGMAGQGNWSHDAVWHAAKECGFENLNRLATDLSLKLFERNYAIAVRRILAGLPLQSMPLAVTHHQKSSSTPEVARAALAELRKQRGARNA
ncbi:replication protein P [Pseudomonas baltica]|uniref:replication protein P n=1 Tax=Pseudomonas baltica TaxID=2762576 RepID=UPI0028A17DA6|nr:replication protein P [Pseudomonas baltica]